MDFKLEDDLVRDYLEDSRELLAGIEAQLLELERRQTVDPDCAQLAEVLSGLHTHKGNSGMMGFATIQHYIHCLEDLFKSVQNAQRAWSFEFAAFTLQSISILRDALDRIADGELDDPLSPDAQQALDAMLQDREEEPPATEMGKSSLPDGEPDILRETEVPEAEEDDGTTGGNGAGGGNGTGGGNGRSAISKTDVIKVDFHRLDQLVNLMGELVIYRTRLGRIEQDLLATFGEENDILDLGFTSEQIGKLTTELHEAVMQVRMVPMRHVLMRFPRFVRDLAREHDKRIELIIDGEETELDKTVIDEIGEPLVHLIRNAVDHGIESPADRLRAGKPETGHIAIRVAQESSHILIVVEDDGRGIDERHLIEKARAAGWSGSSELGRREILELIFLPGLSTASQVSEVSGRGIGMDIVRRSLARINGSIEVESEIGHGTRFTIKLPLTLAIVSALMVRTGEEQYALPLTSVIENFRVDPGKIHQVNGREVIHYRGRVLPLVRLSQLFGMSGSEAEDRGYIVTLQTSVGKVGLIVEGLLGQQDIVIKALDDTLGEADGIAGATILGDGRVVLIVDVHELWGHVHALETVERMEPHHAEQSTYR